MQSFPTIDRVNEILNDIADSIPEELYKGLSAGIVLLENSKIHREAINEDLYILGEYSRSPMEKQIKIYYGSFKKIYPSISEKNLKERLREVLIHELTHHLEYRAGFNDLEVEDKNSINRYKKRYDISE